MEPQTLIGILFFLMAIMAFAFAVYFHLFVKDGEYMHCETCGGYFDGDGFFSPCEPKEWNGVEVPGECDHCKAMRLARRNQTINKGELCR